MMVLNPAPEGGLGASLRPGLTGLVQSDKQGGMRTYSSSNELTFSSIWRKYLVWRKNNDLNPVFHQNCKRLFSFTGIYRGHGREKLEQHVFFLNVQLTCKQVRRDQV